MNALPVSTHALRVLAIGQADSAADPTSPMMALQAIGAASNPFPNPGRKLDQKKDPLRSKKEKAKRPAESSRQDANPKTIESIGFSKILQTNRHTLERNMASNSESAALKANMRHEGRRKYP